MARGCWRGGGGEGAAFEDPVETGSVQKGEQSEMAVKETISTANISSIFQPRRRHGPIPSDLMRWKKMIPRH